MDWKEWGKNLGQTSIAGIADGAIGAGFSILNSYLTNKWQWQTDQKRMALQHDYNEASADSAMQRNLSLYNQTESTQAKVKEMENAGLSVGLLNGAPSSGGATAPTVQGAGLPQGNVPQALGLMGELGLMSAQTRKLNAETNNIEADTGKKHTETFALGKQVQVMDEQIKKLIAETNSETAKQLLLSIEADFKETTFWTDVSAAEKKLEELIANIGKLKSEENLNTQQHTFWQETWELQKNLLGARQDLMISQTELNDEQKSAVQKHLDILWDANNTKFLEVWQQPGLTEMKIKAEEAISSMITEANKEIAKLNLELESDKLIANTIIGILRTTIECLAIGFGLSKAGFLKKIPKIGYGR